MLVTLQLNNCDFQASQMDMLEITRVASMFDVVYTRRQLVAVGLEGSRCLVETVGFDVGLPAARPRRLWFLHCFFSFFTVFHSHTVHPNRFRQTAKSHRITA